MNIAGSRWQSIVVHQTPALCVLDPSTAKRDQSRPGSGALFSRRNDLLSGARRWPAPTRLKSSGRRVAGVRNSSARAVSNGRASRPARQGALILDVAYLVHEHLDQCCKIWRPEQRKPDVWPSTGTSSRTEISNFNLAGIGVGPPAVRPERKGLWHPPDRKHRLGRSSGRYFMNLPSANRGSRVAFILDAGQLLDEKASQMNADKPKSMSPSSWSRMKVSLP